ncbi:uncharacterized protein METZ01_LOCUS320354, partial [marine metagenome]
MGGPSWPSDAAIVTAIVASPVTLTTVRNISRIRSTPSINAIPVLGTPIASKMITSMIIPAPGTAAVPIEARTAVR